MLDEAVTKEFVASLNRTRVELKFLHFAQFQNESQCLNRTRVELKYVASVPSDVTMEEFESHQSGIEMRSNMRICTTGESLNRTRVELKLETLEQNESEENVFESHQSGIEINSPIITTTKTQNV